MLCIATALQLVASDGTGAPMLTDMGASFVIAPGGVLTLSVAAPRNGSSVSAELVDEVSSAVFEKKIAANLPSATQFTSPRLFLNTRGQPLPSPTAVPGSTSRRATESTLGDRRPRHLE